MAKPGDAPDTDEDARSLSAPETPAPAAPDGGDGYLKPRPERVATSVLVVDDEASVLRTVGLMLEYGGFTVFTAASGAEALAWLSLGNCFVQVLVTDQNMPHMTGTELVARMLERGIDLPVLFMSGQPQRELVHEARGTAPRRFLAKPFTQATLIGAVQALLQSARGELTLDLERSARQGLVPNSRSERK